MPKVLYLPLGYLPWTAIKRKDGSNCVPQTNAIGFVEVFESRGECAAAYPGCKVMLMDADEIEHKEHPDG